MWDKLGSGHCCSALSDSKREYTSATILKNHYCHSLTRGMYGTTEGNDLTTLAVQAQICSNGARKYWVLCQKQMEGKTWENCFFFLIKPG